MPILEARTLSKWYTVDNRRISVLEDISFAVAAGEFLVVEGSSGSGKTTLVSLLSGLDKPSRGRVIFEGNDITDAGEDALAPLRNRDIGFVFQSFHLVPSLNALENVMFPAELAGAGDAAERARYLLERVGMASRCHNMPEQLSGGEKQRVAICRALINRPRLIFADEPTGNLDSENGNAVVGLLREFQQETNATLILVTHNRAIAETADRIIHLTDGRITGIARHAA